MAILSDTFGGFSLSSQQGKLASTRVLRGVSDTRLPGKLTSSRLVREVYHDLKPIKIEKFFTSAISINDNNQVGKLTSAGLLKGTTYSAKIERIEKLDTSKWYLVPINDYNQVGKLTSRSLLKGIQDVTTVSKITTLPSNFYQFVDYFASDIKSFGKLKSAHTVKGLISDNNVKTYSKLSRFSPTDNPSDYTVNVVGQSLDTTTDVYTIDSIFLENNPTSSYLWTKESPTSSSNKTLYFVNQLNIKFEVGETVRIRNVNANYSELVTVIASTSNSITYSSNNLLPEISGTFIDSGSTLYERRYFNALDATNSMQRYALSVIAPGLKGISYPFQIASGFNDSAIKETLKLSLYAPSDNPSEHIIQVRGQSLDSSTDTYTTDSIFTENNPTSSYLWTKESPTSSNIKTLYFVKQNTAKFFAGDVVRIKNTTANYSEFITILSITPDSLTYSSNNLLPEISGTFIDSGSPVYRRLYYNESTASNEFKNYIFSIMAPGLKGVAYPYQEAKEFPDKLKTIPKIDSSYRRITYDELTASNEFKNYIFSIIAPGLKGVAYPYQEARSFSDININLGIINKLKTGDFKIGSNGIQDPATIKKAPVQFWS